MQLILLSVPSHYKFVLYGLDTACDDLSVRGMLPRVFTRGYYCFTPSGFIITCIFKGGHCYKVVEAN
jgi:hypothetical protein